MFQAGVAFLAWVPWLRTAVRAGRELVQHEREVLVHARCAMRLLPPRATPLRALTQTLTPLNTEKLVINATGFLVAS